MEKSRTEKTPISGIKCPACKHEESRVVRIGIREDPKWPVWICKNCRVHFIEPRYKDIRKYYEEEYRKNHDAAPGRSWSAEERYQFQHYFAQHSKKYLLDHIPAGGSLLDVGASAGGFIGTMQDEFDVHALEWNPEDVEFLMKHDIPVASSSIEDAFPGQTFNVITALQVLEHQTDPVEFIQSLKSKLVGGGYLYLEVPHVDDALVAVYNNEKYREFFYREPHITYWNANNLANFLAMLGFETHTIWYQRYGLFDHMYWYFNQEPVPDPYAARLAWKPINPKHPQAASFNRFFWEMDAQYRLLMEALDCTDTLRAVARWREI